MEKGEIEIYMGLHEWREHVINQYLAWFSILYQNLYPTQTLSKRSLDIDLLCWVGTYHPCKL
jgi:hypothetical protein